jgi:hypothetical protein
MVNYPDNFDKEEIDSRIDKATNIPVKLRKIHRNILHCFYWYGDELQRIGYTLAYVEKNIKWPVLYSKLLICNDPWEYVIEKIKKDKIKIEQFMKNNNK